MSDFRVVQPSDEQWPDTSHAIMQAFGVAKDDGNRKRDSIRPPQRRLALTQGDKIVGGCFAYAFDLTLPGGAVVPCAGLAGVGILPTHQGGGGLRQLIQSHLQNSKALGDTVSALMASESGLYGRFGYGVATEMASYRLETAHFQLTTDVQITGNIELISDEEQARSVCAEIHRANRTAGDLQRSAAWWQHVIHADERSWLGGGVQFIAVHRDDSGQADAFALYAIEEQPNANGVIDGLQHGKLELRELLANNTNAELAMWQYLCNIAWVRELHWILAPADPMVKHAMRDARQLVQTGKFDMLWLRVLDMPRLLRERHYSSSGSVQFCYTDELFPEHSGCYSLTANADNPALNSVERLPDSSMPMLSFGPQQLAAFALGGTRVVRLYWAGQVQGPERDMRQLDMLMLTDVAPFNLSKF